MVLYEILFQIAVLLFIPSFVFWLLSELFSGKGLETIYMVFIYPTIILVISATILAMIIEELSLNIKLMFAGIALVWFVTYRMIEFPSKSRWHKVMTYMFQIMSIFGAWLILEQCFFIS
ncbi:MAG: hypothetical protein U9R34_07480 [Nanoarchaeota archaeon]|nr:hypothetical protein [Nanoarchaeota archaeon]